jgi:N-acetylglutamate synthase-like GNAT family acetyltransferase
MARSTEGDSFAEKEFYLDEFRGKSLLFALPAEELARSEGEAECVFADLLLNGTRILLLVSTSGEKREIHRVQRLQEHLSRSLPASPPIIVRCPSLLAELDHHLLWQIWMNLRAHPLCFCLMEAPFSVPLATFAQGLAVRLKVYKFILIGAEGGIVTEQGERFSFMNGAVLEELLRRGEAEWTGLGRCRTLLEAVRAALVGGVASVSLCPLSGLAKELFTYDGCGTFFTLTDYCQVERLGIDDFYEVERLLERGKQEGYLKARSPEEIGRVLLAGYGAKIGPQVGHLAGICSLQPYEEANAGEIAGLYTITRFKGEGIGSKLVAKMITAGERLGLSFLFACTTQEGAQRLFERQGFYRVSPEEVPAEKWQGYDPERKKQIAVYKLVLPARQGGQSP